jgi:urease accessory protein
LNMVGNENPKSKIRSPKEARNPKSERASARLDNTDFLLWQLADSAFPTGGFAHSAGLEAAWQHGEVRNRAELISHVEASLHQLGHAAMPFVMAAHTEPDRLSEFDSLCDAFTTNHVANRASRTQGKAFLAAVQRVFVDINIQANSAVNGDGGVKSRRIEKGRAPFGHFAPVFGACLRHLDISDDTTGRLFFFGHLRGVMAAAVRLNIVGPMEAQAIQHQFAPRAERVLKDCVALTPDEIAQTSPLLDLWQGAQDRLYSRLFQS